MKKRILACALALLLMVSVLVGCSEQMPLVYVQSVAELIGYGSIGAYNSCAGVVLAQEETSIEKDESRKIKSLSVEVGQYVNEGDILFTYDRKHIYKGCSTYSSDILYTIEGHIPMAILVLLM